MVGTADSPPNALTLNPLLSGFGGDSCPDRVTFGGWSDVAVLAGWMEQQLRNRKCVSSGEAAVTAWRHGAQAPAWSLCQEWATAVLSLMWPTQLEAAVRVRLAVALHPKQAVLPCVHL